MSLAIVFATVLIGSVAQRITGMGFAVVAAPFIILTVGGAYGVVVINSCAAFISAAMLTRVWPNVDWPRFRVLAVGGVCGVLPGLWVISHVPSAWLELTVGLVVVAALVLGQLMSPNHEIAAPRRQALYAGVAGGFMNTAAGMGGPAVSVYAFATNWKHERFAATMQPYFLLLSPVTIVAVVIASNRAELPSAAVIGGLVAACSTGLIVGELISTRVSAKVASRTLFVLAVTGATVATIRGAASL